MVLEPPADLGRLVGRGVVEHDVDLETLGHRALDLVQEASELLGPVPRGHVGDHLAGERGSIVVTSNRSFEQWGEILGDAMVAAALIDPLVHHAEIVTLKSKSYRLRECTGAVTPADQAPSLRDSARSASPSTGALSGSP